MMFLCCKQRSLLPLGMCREGHDVLFPSRNEAMPPSFFLGAALELGAPLSLKSSTPALALHRLEAPASPLRDDEVFD